METVIWRLRHVKFFLTHYQNFTDCQKTQIFVSYGCIRKKNDDLKVFCSRYVDRQNSTQINGVIDFTHFHVSGTLFFGLRLTLYRKTFFNMKKNREAFLRFAITKCFTYDGVFNVQSDFHEVQNAFTNYPCVTFNVVDRRAFGERRNIFTMNVC